MEEFWDDSGPYALAKLADRLVPVPRDTEPPVSLYALARAWVRNNPVLPLGANTPSPLQRPGSTGGATSGEGLQGGPMQQSPEQQELPEPQSSRDSSLLPPLLSLPPLLTETSPPTYPLDDFEAQEPEEALRKLKDHWGAVRQYHQAVRRARLSRYGDRLQVLLGEPTLMFAQAQPTMQQPAAAHPQPVSTEAVMASPLHNIAPNGMPGIPHIGPVGFQGTLMADPTGGPAQGLSGDPGSGQLVGATGLPVSAADAHAALATILSLGQPFAEQSCAEEVAQVQTGGGPADFPSAQQQQQLLLQLQQAGLAPANGVASGPTQTMDVQARQQQLPQDTAQVPVQARPPMFGELSAAMVAASVTEQAPISDKEASNADAFTAVPKQEMLETGNGQDGVSRMDIDPIVPDGT